MAATVLAECRPRLGACYFFVRNVPNAGESSVEVGEQTISVRVLDEQLWIFLPSSLTLVSGSISGQTSTNCSLVFRTRIKDFSSTASADNSSNQFSPDSLVNDAFSLSCDFCHEPLTEARVYSRVLPLPSSDEPNDFFCHWYSDEPVSLDPKPSDFFYNNFFYKINADNFLVPLTNNKFRCPKCLELLGEVRGNCVKLWNSVVSFSVNENEVNSIEKFIKSLVHFIRNLPMQMNKFVFTSSHGSLSHYTLMWVVDRALVVLNSPNRSDCIESVEHNIHLVPKKVMKVLYSKHEQLTETVSEWMKSFNTSIIPIHPRIESCFLKYLKHFGDSIPAAACSVIDGMEVSYLAT